MITSSFDPARTIDATPQFAPLAATRCNPQARHHAHRVLDEPRAFDCRGNRTGVRADVFEAGGTSEDGSRETFVARAVTNHLPSTLVVVDGSKLVGTGSIKHSVPGTKPGILPWLAGMYVRRGVPPCGCRRVPSVETARCGIQSIEPTPLSRSSLVVADAYQGDKDGRGWRCFVRAMPHVSLRLAVAFGASESRAATRAAASR